MKNYTKKYYKKMKNKKLKIAIIFKPEGDNFNFIDEKERIVNLKEIWRIINDKRS